MARSQVDLLIPGLFQLPGHEFDANFLSRQLPSLNRLLRFARPVPNSLVDLDAILADCLGLEQTHGIPFASAFIEEGSTEQAGYVLLRPVHLKPDMRNVFALPLEENQEIRTDINILINDLGELFKADCDISDLGDGLWMMRLKQCQPPRHYPHYLSVVGRKVNQYIEQSRSSLPWYQLLNEMQMFMHSHAVNQQRLLDDKLPINSLWCWGAGKFLPPKKAYTTWYCDDIISRRYADKAGIDNQPISALAGTELTGDSLVIDVSILKVLKSSVDSDLQTVLTSLETSVFAPLISAVNVGRISLRLRAGHENDLILSGLSGLKRWRKPVSLADRLV